jgi:subfamily B ATP-binding cassette protein MsbA
MSADRTQHVGILSSILRFIKPYKRWFYQGLALTTLSTVISLVPPILMGVIVDQVIGQGRRDLFWPVLLAYILTPLIANAIGWVNNLIISLIGDKLVLDMRKQLYEHLQYLPMRFYDKSSTGAVMERLMGDVAQVNQMVSSQTIALVTDVVASSVALVVMMNLNWRMTCLLMVVLPLYIVNFRYFSEKVRIWREAFREKIEDMSSSVQERLAGTAAIKAFGQETNETRQFLGTAGEARVVNLKAHFYSVAFGSTSSLIYWLGQTGIYLMGCYLVIQSEMTLGQVIAFTSYCVYLLQPALRFSNISAVVERSMVSVRRVFELLDEQREPGDADDAVEVRRLRGDVSFENVKFEYDPGSPVIRDFTLDVPAGSTVALVGHTGCGKTTMISLLMRFYRPVEGRIAVDGVGLNDYSRLTLRRNISLVPQDPVLFEGTVRDNICYGRRGASLDDVVAAAKAAEIHKAIMELPDGYDTMLGEEGAKLSVGQKQRLVIARAILADPAILILDEATSALDTESERLLQRALDRIMENRTSFVIAHRLSTIVGADMIVMMSEGRILEVGRHQDLLMKEDGHYRQLYFTQFAKVA